MITKDMIDAAPYIALIISLIALLLQSRSADNSAREAARLAKEQMANALSVARKQIVAPIRQQWIDELRGLLSDYIATAQFQWIKQNYDEGAHQKLLLLYRKIALMLNLNEKDHHDLRRQLDDLLAIVINFGQARAIEQFTSSIGRCTEYSQAVLKREWERVKSEEC